VANFTKLVLKNSEHTWGGDVKTILNDEVNWTNDLFAAQLAKKAENYEKMISTWVEQRDWGLAYPIEALGDHPLRETIHKELAGLLPPPYDSAVPEGFIRVDQPNASITCGGGVEIGFDIQTGAINHLKDAEGVAWAAPDAMLGIYEYRTHSTEEYNTFFADYAQRQGGKIPSYFPKDFGKPGCYEKPEMANASLTLPRLERLYIKVDPARGVTSFWVALSIPDQGPLRAHTRYGAPEAAVLLVDVAGPDTTREGLDVNVTLRLYNKTATRLPESHWLRFTPPPRTSGTSGAGGGLTWGMEKLGSHISPLEVCHNGSRHIHAVEAVTASREHGGGFMRVTNLDVPVVSFGSSSPFPTPDEEPDLSRGVSYAISDNIWGTNYVMWYPFVDSLDGPPLQGDADAQYRWHIQFSSKPPPGPPPQSAAFRQMY